jgi:hypothetical protein
MILDETAVRAIADLLGSEVHKAPFEVPKLDRGHEGQPATELGPVFQVSIRSQELGEPLLITLWPSLSRVDVRLGQSYLALRGITSVEIIYPGVEVLFRRDDPSAFLFVSVKGRVALVA